MMNKLINKLISNRFDGQTYFYRYFSFPPTDITPRFAGILMAFTNCTANLAGLLAPIVAGNLIDQKVRKCYFFAILPTNSR